MRTYLRGKVTLLFMTFGLLLAIPAVALADQLQDELTSAPASATITQNDSNGFTNDYYVKAVGGGTPPVCDISATNPAEFKINVPAGSGVVATPNTLKFEACGDASTNTQSVKFTSSTANNTTGYAITATQTSGPTSPGISTGDAAFTLFVNPAPSDTTAPTVTASAVKGDAPDFTGATSYTADTWTNKDVKVTFTCADNAGGSGLTAASGNQVKTFTTETNGTTATFDGTCKDNAGNTAAASSFGPIKIDKTNPTIDGSASPAANSAGWNNTNVTVSFDCADALSGVVSCPADVTLSSDGADQSVTRSVSDTAGNSAEATVGNIDIDKTKPSVSVTGVSSGANYTTGAVPTPGCNTTDGLSGVKTDATVNVTGGNNGFGTFTATCSGAVDNADNPQNGPVSVQYTVSAAFDGFLQPIDGHSVNTGKFGRTYPIKWQLRDSSGALISDSAAQALVTNMTGGQKAASCTSFDLTDSDALEESTTGNTALRYDATSDQFIYNYKAPTTGNCYVFAIRGVDGVSTHTEQIDFKFTK